MWIHSACALAFQRLGMLGESQEQHRDSCQEIVRHITETSLASTHFCMFKAYADLLQLENKLRSHNFYVKTANLAIKTYSRLLSAGCTVGPCCTS